MRLLLLVLLASTGPIACARSIAPPISSPPSAEAALARMRDTLACGRAMQATAKIDHFGDRGRVRADVLLFAARPARIRMDVVSPFGAALATLTSDGARFSLADLRERRTYVGPASACNIARLTAVPLPGHVLVDLLRGQAPVLRHDPHGPALTIAWNTEGYWVLTIPAANEAREEIHMAPRPEDWARPWQSQQMRVLDVRVRQQGYVLYHAALGDHSPAPMATPREDPDGLAAPLPPSGPNCTVEVPRRIQIEIGDAESDMRILYQQVLWNPPLPGGTFEPLMTPGMPVETVICE
jgi:hypothetical protein